MPIREDLKKFYDATWRKVTRPRILERAGHKCEQCGVPNHATVQRAQGWWRSLETWVTPQGVKTTLTIPLRAPRKVYIVLCIGHLNHTPGDDRDENLKALCQWCHLNFDEDHHRETRMKRKDAKRPILVELERAKAS